MGLYIFQVSNMFISSSVLTSLLFLSDCFVASGQAHYCNDCGEVLIESSGTWGDLYPKSLGRFHPDGTLWEGSLTIFKSIDSADVYLTVGPYSNPVIYTIQWVVSNFWSVGPDYETVTIRSQGGDGIIICPWTTSHDISWEYRDLTNQNFVVDNSIKIT